MFPRWRERAVAYFTQALMSAYEEAERRAEATIAQRIETHLTGSQPEAMVISDTPPPTVVSHGAARAGAFAAAPAAPTRTRRIGVGAQPRAPAGPRPRPTPEGAAAIMKPRHLKLLRHLCLDVRLMDAGQAVRLMAVAGDEPADTNRELAEARLEKLPQPHAVLCAAAHGDDRTANEMEPGEEVTDFAALRVAARPEMGRAARGDPDRPAGPAARHVFGSGSCSGGLNFAALSHDLACADLLLTFAERHPERLRDWVGEDVRKQGTARGEKLPDVMLCGERGPLIWCARSPALIRKPGSKRSTPTSRTASGFPTRSGDPCHSTQRSSRHERRPSSGSSPTTRP